MSERLIKDFPALLLALLLVLLLVLPQVGFAEESTMPWESLSPQEQQVLKPFEPQWATFPEARKKRLLAGAERWMNATPEQRQIMKQRFGAWKDLPEEKKQLLRQKFQEFKLILKPLGPK